MIFAGISSFPFFSGFLGLEDVLIFVWLFFSSRFRAWRIVIFKLSGFCCSSGSGVAPEALPKESKVTKYRVRRLFAIGTITVVLGTYMMMFGYLDAQGPARAILYSDRT